MARKSTKGTCTYCSQRFTGRGMPRHLRACKARTSALKSSDNGDGIFLIKAFAGPYWLFVEAESSARLEDLDGFLRNIWLECCGHLSAFTINGTRYDSSPSPNPFFESQNMKVPLKGVLAEGLSFEHEYDFGTTTHLKLNVVSHDQGEIPQQIHLIARNEPPTYECVSCGKEATRICAQCIFEGESVFCDECIKEHECGENMSLPLVNSPRTGVCGYCG